MCRSSRTRTLPSFHENVSTLTAKGSQTIRSRTLTAKGSQTIRSRTLTAKGSRTIRSRPGSRNTPARTRLCARKRGERTDDRLKNCGIATLVTGALALGGCVNKPISGQAIAGNEFPSYTSRTLHVAADDGKKYDVLVVFFDYRGFSFYLFDCA